MGLGRGAAVTVPDNRGFLNKPISPTGLTIVGARRRQRRRPPLARPHHRRSDVVGVAALGTALPREQARHLRRYTNLPIVATDNDPAGQAAAERAYWMLTGLGLDPLHSTLPEGTDPADLAAQRRPQDLTNALRASIPLSRVLFDRSITQHASEDAIRNPIRIVAAADPPSWPTAISKLAVATGRPIAELEMALVTQLHLEAGFDQHVRRPPEREGRSALLPNSDSVSIDASRPAQGHPGPDR